MKRRTGQVLNQAPNGIVTLHPLHSKIVTSFSATRLVLGRFVHRIRRNHALISPHVMVNVPDNIANMRQQTIVSTTRRTNTHAICLVSRPITTTVKTKLPITRPANGVVISVNKNAARITILDLRNAMLDRSMQITKSRLDRSVSDCVGGMRGLIINRHATRRVGVAVNSTCPDPGSGRVTVSIQNLRLLSNLPHAIAIGDTRVHRDVTRPLSIVVRTIGHALRHAPPRLTTSVVSQNVVLTKNKTLLGNLSALVDRRANVIIRITTSPLDYIILKAKQILRGFDRVKQIFDKHSDLWPCSTSSSAQILYLPCITNKRIVPSKQSWSPSPYLLLKYSTQPEKQYSVGPVAK